MNAIVERLSLLFSPERMSKYVVDELLPDVFMTLVVLVAVFVIWKLVKRVSSVAFQRSELDETAQAFVLTVAKFVVVTIGVVTGLAQVGVDITSLITSLGVAGLTIGFAARDALSNIISGLFIFWDRPFVIGDFVEISGEYGRVDAITMRSTRVVTVDGRMLAIPNSTVVNTTVASYTNFPHLRLDIDFTVAVTEDLSRVREVALSVVAADDRFGNETPPRVVVTALNDYNVAMSLQVWLLNERTHVPSRFELREKLFLALRDANVDMPYETLALTPVDVRTKAA